jgi:hypothetical protein
LFTVVFPIEAPASGNIQVKEEWIASYNGPQNDHDSASAIAVDQSSGNIYVTGSSKGIGTNYDIVTLAYDSKGNELWVARYNGPANDMDRGYAIALDSTGNIYVTGFSDCGISLNPLDFVTIAYDSSGVQIWVARYNGPARSNDVPVAIAVDESYQSVYVTGTSHGGFISSGGTESDFVTIAYYLSNGTQRWVTRYNNPQNRDDSPCDMAVDKFGNVIVFGGSEYIDKYSEDFLTISLYPSNGTIRWYAIYNGPGNSHDVAIAMTTDVWGNVIATGWSSIGSKDQNFTTVKYDQNGKEQWVKSYANPQNDNDVAKDICTDFNGNIYVTGFSYINATHASDYITVAYDPLGEELWIARYNGPGSDRDSPQSIICDSNGNLYVTGWSKGYETDYDFATVGYDSLGNELWVVRYNSPDNYIDWAEVIALDSSQNMYVAGRSYGTDRYSNIVTLKYSFQKQNLNGVVDIDPNTLNLKSKGKWITCYISLPNGYDVNEINIHTVMLENTVSAKWGDVQGEIFMVKFDRSDVQDILSAGTYNLKITGELADGTPFEGYSDEIRVKD